MNRLGIIDWGIGGVSIYRLIRERIGDVPVTYFSDTGVTPYGRMTRPELVDRLNTVIRYLKSRGVTHLVIGCNAASTAIPFLAEHDIPIKGVIEPAIEMTSRLKPARLGVIGGRRTVLSGVYRRAFAKRGIPVRQRIAAAAFSPHRERRHVFGQSSPRGRPDTCSGTKLLAHPACLHALSGDNADAEDACFARHGIVDPAAELVRKVDRWQLTPGGKSEFLTSGDTASMAKAAKRAFGVDIGKPSTISI